MAEFGKWTSAIEDPPKETGTYLIIGAFGFIHNREDELRRYDQIAIGYYDPGFGWLSDTPGFEDAKYWMELPPDKPNENDRDRR